MSRNLSETEIFNTIVAIVSDALAVDINSLQGKTRLFRELQAESIDVVDVRFRMEQAFGIKIDQRDLMSSLGQGLTTEEIIDRFTVSYLVSYVKKQMG